MNCGRNALAYLFKSRRIKKIAIPYLICSSIPDVCDRENVEKRFYHIGIDFKPDKNFILDDDEWFYLVNFYGQLSNDELKQYIDKYGRVIIDQANAYFEEPIPGVDTIYTCRKWFGVADGAFLYTDSTISEELHQDESYERMHFLLGRYERAASEFYNEYTKNNTFFANEPIKSMSKLTQNLLHGINYKDVEQRRKENFDYLQKKLGDINELQLKTASFMFPLMVKKGVVIRKMLQEKKIYIPTLWPLVLDITKPEDLEYRMAQNILPLPIDQRYDLEDMKYMTQQIIYSINNVEE